MCSFAAVHTSSHLIRKYTMLSALLLLAIAAISEGHFLPTAVDMVRNQRFLEDATVQKRLCRTLPGLTDQQRSWCRSHPPFIAPIAQGADLGLLECGRQFQFERWNCSLNESITNFNYIKSAGSRETSFVSSIQAAGITLAIARICSSGNVTRFCSCDASVHNQNIEHNIKGKFSWGGCGDNFAKGYQYSKEFLDVAHHQDHIEQTKLDLMELHNNEAGRAVVQSTLQTICKCHGLTGACSVKICWRSLPKVQIVGLILKEKYRNAIQVNTQPSASPIPSPAASGRKLVQVDPHSDRPETMDLVYLAPSPDYCIPNATIGINGTAGRECNVDSRGDDGCELLCCGNGHYVKRSVLRQKCRCKFIFCCEVVCDTCVVAWETHMCNAPRSLTRRDVSRSHSLPSSHHASRLAVL